MTTELAEAGAWSTGRLGTRGGRRLVFGRMYEDSAVEVAAFRGRTSILAIASAGDTAFALARAGHRVTAIDINPTQVQYIRQRQAGRPTAMGEAERLLALGRLLLRAAGWSRRRTEAFARLSDRSAQVAAWHDLTSGLPGAAFRMLLSPAALRAGYQAAFVDAGARLGDELPRRIERGLALHSNRDNPWARLLFTGRWPTPDSLPSTSVNRVELIVGDVARHLERVSPGTYDGFTLSNVLDGASDGYRRRLAAAVRHAATPGAVVVLRTLTRPDTSVSADLAPLDRALIWGGLTISTPEEL